DIAAGSRRYLFTRFGKAMEILDTPQQRLAAMQDDGQIDQRIFGDMLLDAAQELVQHIRAHQLRLLVDRCVAEPVAIGAINVASRCNLHKKLRDRLMPKGDRTWIISRHADTAMHW